MGTSLHKMISSDVALVKDKTVHHNHVPGLVNDKKVNDMLCMVP